MSRCLIYTNGGQFRKIISPSVPPVVTVAHVVLSSDSPEFLERGSLDEKTVPLAGAPHDFQGVGNRPWF